MTWDIAASIERTATWGVRRRKVLKPVTRLPVALIALVVVGCSSVTPILDPGAWRVDVVNGPRRVIVSVSPGGLYIVEPNTRVTLFEADGAKPGGIEVIEATNDGCILLDKAPFAAGSFTITLSGEVEGDYMMTLDPGTVPVGLPGAERTTDCMG